MSTGVYLVKGVLDIFDKMEKLGIKKINRIINDLKEIYSNSPNYLEIIQMGKDKVTSEILKQILGTKHTENDYNNFVQIFRNIQKGEAVRNMTYAEDSYLGTTYKGSEFKDMHNKYFGSKKDSTNKGNNKVIKFTDDFWLMLDKMIGEIAVDMYNIPNNPSIDNKLNIETIDVSDDEYNFDVYYYNGKRGTIKVSEFIRSYCSHTYDRSDIYMFVRDYNEIIREVARGNQVYVKVPEFKFDPKNIKNTFISLTTETYPHGHEEEVLKYLPKDLIKDEYGNYYKIIGDSNTMFTSHFDTASRTKSKVRLVEKEKEGNYFIASDGTTILGADDKAGVTVMLYMMAHNIPGIYYFFIGEERGGIGSGNVADNFHKFTFLKKANKCVSFDRRNYYSVITSQGGTECCSDSFGNKLCEELNKHGLSLELDPTGVFTDSANFVDYIPECTNISVGYFNEHTHDEIQNITYLEKLAKACVSINWDKIEVSKKVGFDEATLAKWSDLLNDVRDCPFYNDIKVKGQDGKIVVQLDFDDDSLSNCYEDLSFLESAFMAYRCDPDIRFDGNTMKIFIK